MRLIFNALLFRFTAGLLGCAFVFTLYCCRHQVGQRQKGDATFLRDSLQLEAVVDSMSLLHHKYFDHAFNDSVYIQFNNVAVARKYPKLVTRAFLCELSCTHFDREDAVAQYDSLAGQSNDNDMRIWVEFLTATRYYKYNDNNSALPRFLKTKTEFEAIKDTIGAMLSCKRLSDIYFNISENQKSLDYARLALAYSVKGDDMEKYLRLYDIAQKFQALQMLDSADYYLEKSRAASGLRKILFVRGKFTNMLNAFLYYKQGNIDSLNQAFDMYMAECKKYREMGYIPYTYALFAKMFIGMHQYKRAEELVKPGLLYVDSVHQAVQANKDIYEAASMLYDSIGDFKKAYLYRCKLNEAVASFNLDNQKAEIKNREASYEFTKEKQSLEAEKALKEEQLKWQQRQKSFLVAGAFLLLLLILVIQQNLRNQKKAREKSEKLLLNILPAEVAAELSEKGSALPRHFAEVTIIFTDFKNFTTVGEKLSPAALVIELNECFKAFDEIMAKHNIEKIKTVGDAYLAVSGLPVPNPNHAVDVVKAAIEIRQFMISRYNQSAGGEANKYLNQVRIGINSGEVVAGIVGVNKFSYDIWGDAVNTAARMEQNGEVQKINISEATYNILCKIGAPFKFTYRGELEAKNKGKMKMYFVD